MATTPNIILLLPDQLRADYLGCYGAEFAETPNIDRLCSDSVQYTGAVSPSPLCVPARASLLTGYNAIRTGVFTNDQWLRPDHARCGMPTWPQIVSARGYHTEAIGKMHFYPWDISEGFAHRVIAEDKRHYEIQDDYADYLRRHGYAKYHARENPGYRQHLGAAPSRIPLEHQVDLWTADRTVEFLRTYSGDQPFACMVGLPGPHCPYDPPDELADRFDPRTMPDSVPETPESEQLRPQTIEACKREWCDLDYTHFPESARRLIRSYYSSLVHIVDRAVGRILVALEERDDSDSTVVIFASDHGDFLGDYGHIGKRFLFRPSIHIPLLVRLPGGTHEVVPEPVSLTDLFATIVHLAGVHNADTPDAQVLPRVRANADRRREYVFGASPDGYMVIRGPWKLSWYRNGVRSLIHTDRDPDEQTNLYGSGEARPVVQELTEIMNREVYDSLRLANGDKIVDRSIRSAGRTFFERGWERDYPNDPSDG